jgi:hypothetical protein
MSDTATRQSKLSVLLHVDPLLGNDREISNYKTAIVR